MSPSDSCTFALSTARCSPQHFRVPPLRSGECLRLAVPSRKTVVRARGLVSRAPRLHSTLRHALWSTPQCISPRTRLPDDPHIWHALKLGNRPTLKQIHFHGLGSDGCIQGSFRPAELPGTVPACRLQAVSLSQGKVWWTAPLENR